MTSYYDPDYYISKIVDNFKELGASLKERSQDAREMETFEKSLREIEGRLKALENQK